MPSVVSFLVPFVLADRIGLQRDVYYGVYAAIVTALFGAWAHDTGQSLRAMVARRWPWAVVANDYDTDLFLPPH